MVRRNIRRAAFRASWGSLPAIASTSAGCVRRWHGTTTDPLLKGCAMQSLGMPVKPVETLLAPLKREEVGMKAEERAKDCWNAVSGIPAAEIFPRRHERWLSVIADIIVEAEREAFRAGAEAMRAVVVNDPWWSDFDRGRVEHLPLPEYGE